MLQEELALDEFSLNKKKRKKIQFGDFLDSAIYLGIVVNSHADMNSYLDSVRIIILIPNCVTISFLYQVSLMFLLLSLLVISFYICI